MPDPRAALAQRLHASIRNVTDQASFIQDLLIDGLGWSVDERAQTIEDIGYGWTLEELRAQDLDQRLVEGSIYQLQPAGGNPWGVFILEFQRADVFTRERGMTGVLRKVLRGLVPSKRKSAKLASFKREHLLFVCTHKYQHYRLAYFKSPLKKSGPAPLATFGWGPEDQIRTLCEFNLPELVWPGDGTDADAWVAAWAKAFDVEKVTRQFYTDYARTFTQVEKTIAPASKLAGDELRMYTQTLFNRLMFLRFIERKGWLKFDERHDYLRALFAAGPIGKKSFFNSRLRPLFFEALAVEGRQASPAIGEVPFLNGGLFEEADLDRRVKDLPDEAFEPIIGPDGLFYHYNFTVEESTPLDIEVAVDPEMLGKVFEELVTGRHESGSYYTPRPIVSYMCREALKGVLEDKTKASATAIAALIDDHQIKNLSESHARQILEALDELKAVDPACGSGAYLLGLLHELVRIYRLLYSERLTKDARSLYDLKLRIISQNLYGVDIDPFATNIAMLRLWLSLAVEAADPLALPNLDFKIETGDSLLGPNPQDVPDLFREQLRQQADVLVNVKRQYFSSHGEEKESYYETIQAGEARLREGLHSELGPGVIDWRIQFAEAFSRSGGFDIVLANPPYGIDSANTYTDMVAHRDSYVCFLGLANGLASNVSLCVFIIPTSWETGERFTKFRKWFLTNNRIESLVNLPYDMFEIPFVDTCVLAFRPRKSTLKFDSISVLTLPKRTNEIFDHIHDKMQAIPVTSITSDKSMRLILHGDAPAIFSALSSYPRLGSTARIKRGIEAYQYKIVPTAPNPKWFPFFQGNVHRYTVDESNDQAFVRPKPVDAPWHDGPRLVIRRLVSRSNRLMAACLTRRAVVKKDLYVLKLDEPDDVPSLAFLLGLLNSSLYSYLYLARSAAAQKDDFRQVSLAGLRDLPLPKSYVMHDEVSELVARLETNHLDEQQRAKVETDLDNLVFEMFLVSPDIRQQIAEFLSSKG